MKLNNKRKTIIVIALSVMIIGTIILTKNLLGLQNYKTDERINNFVYGDKFDDVQFYTYKGDRIEDPFVGTRYSVVISLSSGCRSCIDLLSHVPELMDIYQEINFNIVWNDSIPHSLIKKYKIPSENNYSLNGKEVLDVQFPVVFILDSEGTVRFKDIDMGNILDKIKDLGITSEEELMEAGVEYILENYFKNESGEKLLYFYMEGCPDCKAIQPIIESEEIMNRYDEIFYLYRQTTKRQDVVVDRYNILGRVFNITWYPSFLQIKTGEYRIIGQMTPEEIEAELIK